MGDVTPHPAALAAPRYSSPAPLTAAFDVTQFDCGKPPLNDWLKYQALKSEGRSARSYVVLAGGHVVGYYCIAHGAVKRSAELPRKLKNNMPEAVPVMILGRLAVDTNHKGNGIGGGLLKDALLRIMDASKIAGCRGIVVHAIDSEALSFYLRYGFKPVPVLGEFTLFLSIEDAVAALGDLIG